jgi:hypothetical protein
MATIKILKNCVIWFKKRPAIYISYSQYAVTGDKFTSAKMKRISKENGTKQVNFILKQYV